MQPMQPQSRRLDTLPLDKHNLDGSARVCYRGMAFEVANFEDTLGGWVEILFFMLSLALHSAIAQNFTGRNLNNELSLHADSLF